MIIAGRQENRAQYLVRVVEPLPEKREVIVSKDEELVLYLPIARAMRALVTRNGK